MIEIDATKVSEILLPGYPMVLTFNHQALVEQGAAIDGSDLAVVSQHGDEIASLPRILDMQSSWNQPETTIWFTIDEEIDAGTTVRDTYYLVTQDTTIAPVDDRSQVFLEFEDFSTNDLSASLWSQQVSLTGDRNMTQTATGVVLTTSPPTNYPLSYLTLRRRATSYWASIRVDAMTRMTNTGLSGTCGRSFPIALTSEGDNRIRAGFRSDISNYAGLAYDEVQQINQVTNIPSVDPETDTWRLHSISWVRDLISYWQEDEPLLSQQSQGSITQPNQAQLQVEFSIGARSVDCTGSGQLGLEIDWFRVRRFTFPEPYARVLP